MIHHLQRSFAITVSNHWYDKLNRSICPSDPNIKVFGSFQDIFDFSYLFTFVLCVRVESDQMQQSRLLRINVQGKLHSMLALQLFHTCLLRCNLFGQEPIKSSKSQPGFKAIICPLYWGNQTLSTGDSSTFVCTQIFVLSI